ncbi:MAG: amino acid ABC transporter permease [Oscillospiraceae bacterium]|nr:amino acid ABC transporter permease [Oscillospiraceae bacterium]
MAELQAWWLDFQDTFYRCFIEDNRWQYLTRGLENTLRITFFALIIGIVLGVVVAIIRSSYDKNANEMRPGPGKVILSILNIICKIYLTVIRGTPVVVQLLLGVFVIFMYMGDITVACIVFGVNSGAYVAEIFRSGIMSIDNGQFEAGRSLGFNYVQTMRHIILPQAFKNVLPSLANEFIVLIKETSVAGYAGVIDLTKGGEIIRGRTFEAFMPLIAVAIIYLALVMFFTFLIGKLERRLRSSER